MRPLPTRESVGAETRNAPTPATFPYPDHLNQDKKRAPAPKAASLIYDCFIREAGHKKLRSPFYVPKANTLFCLFPNDIEQTLKRIIRLYLVTSSNKYLSHHRFTGPRCPPTVPLSVGTVRQPNTCCPSPLIIASSWHSHACRRARSCGKNTMPTPYCPGSGNDIPSKAQTFRKNKWGVCNKCRPHPPNLVRAGRAAMG